MKYATRMSLLGPALALMVAAAPPVTMRLKVERQPGAEACLDEQALASAVSARAGRTMFDPSSAELISVVLVPKEGGLQARLTRSDAGGAITGTRELISSGSDCRELSDAVQLAIIVAIDPQLALTRTPLLSPPPTAPPPPPVVEPVVEAPVEKPPVVPIHFLIGLGANGGLGLGSGPAVAPLVLLGLRRQAFEIDLEGRVDSSSQVAVGTGSVSLSALLATLSPCYRLAWFGACGVVSTGAIRVTGAGFAVNEQSTVPIVLAGARAVAEWSLPHDFGLRAAVTGQAQLVRTTVTVDRQAVWQTPAFTGDLSVALTWAGF